MPLLFKLTIFLVLLTATPGFDREEKDLEEYAFTVTNRELNEYPSAFDNDHHHHEIEVDDLYIDDNPKSYTNETAVVVKHGRINGMLHRLKWLSKPDAVEDISMSKYDRQRIRPDYNYDYANFRTNYPRSERRKLNNFRGKRHRKMVKSSCQKCGKMFKHKRRIPEYVNFVINGSVVQPAYKYPWIVSLKDENHIFCGGAIISATYTLTAAHCLYHPERLRSKPCRKTGILPKTCYYKADEITVNLLGRHTDEKSQRPERIAKIIPHPKHKKGTSVHDIALIKFARPIQCNYLSSPICLPDSNLQRMGRKLAVTGWGIYARGRKTEFSELLREGTMKQVRPQVCKRYAKEFESDLNDIVCAIGTKSKQSSCMGDSGSSVFAPFSNKIYTIGVTSMHSKWYCQTNRPAIYAKVFRYLKWIKRHVKDLPQSEG